MNLKTYYRTTMADLRLRIADIAPSLAARGGMIYTLSADGADAVIRLGTPSRPVLGYLSGADHPRSRGVYTCGSLVSQRTRSLPDPRRLHCRPRARSAGSP